MSTNPHPGPSEQSWAKAGPNTSLVADELARSRKRANDRSDLLPELLGVLNSYAKMDGVIEFRTGSGTRQTVKVAELVAEYRAKIDAIDAGAAAPGK